MLGGAGVDGAVHKAAGPTLLKACKELKVVKGQTTRCQTGSAILTKGPFGRGKFAFRKN